MVQDVKIGFQIQKRGVRERRGTFKSAFWLHLARPQHFSTPNGPLSAAQDARPRSILTTGNREIDECMMQKIGPLSVALRLISVAFYTLVFPRRPRLRTPPYYNSVLVLKRSCL